MRTRDDGVTCLILLFVLFSEKVKADFLLRPVTQKVRIGAAFHQACSTISHPMFIEWYQNQQKVGSCLFQSNTTSSAISSLKYKLFIGRKWNHFICHLAVTDASLAQNGEYSCRTVHANSDGESASAIVAVFTPIHDVQLHVENETTLSVDQTVKIDCIVKGGRPSPKLRMMLGGELVTRTTFAQKLDASGLTIGNLSATVTLTNMHHWNLLTCDVDMDAYRSINRTFKVIHLHGYRPLEL
ncbi:unnamed protein product [Dicrocoelium dendriticum]|nr:unnamed protein product [Dicrocoelium dendriticum]